MRDEEIRRERGWQRRKPEKTTNDGESWRNYRKRFMLSLPARRSLPGTSMLSGDKVLFFTKPPSVAQARAIRRQWLVNSSQSGGKPRRDRDHSAILLMNYLSGRNNNIPIVPACVLISRQNISRDAKNLVRQTCHDFSNEG